MEKIVHRVNTIEQLRQTPFHYGVEIDIRSEGDHFILHHDPFEQGQDFLEWLGFFGHGTLILNVKEEGLEQRLLAVMQEHQISEFFFLDQSFPFLIKTSSTGESRSAVRVSEYEGLTSARVLAGKVKWAWIDCFTKFPLDQCWARELKEMDFKLCVVSPELQGRTDLSEIFDISRRIDELDLTIDAVCTKLPDLW